jgi:hypothetical protein
MLYSYKTSYGFHLLIAIDDAESKIKGIGWTIAKSDDWDWV